MMEKKAQLGSPEVGGVSKHRQNDGLTSKLIWAFLGLSNLWCLGAAFGSWMTNCVLSSSGSSMCVLPMLCVS